MAISGTTSGPELLVGLDGTSKCFATGSARYLPEATVLGAAAGVHPTVRFPDDCPIAELVRRAADMRVRVEPLAPCYADEAAAPPGLMLGYANVTETQIAEGVRVLARAMR